MTGTMRAIVKEKPEVGAVYRTDVPIPQISDEEVLVKVKATAICGTDQHIYKWAPYAQERLKLPMVFGHEFAGDIVEVGKNVLGYQVGDRVAGETHIPCNQCYQCRTGNQHVCEHMKIIGVHVPGSFGEYINVHKDCLWKLDDSISYVKGSLLEPFGVGVHGVSATPMGGKDVLITGCGPIGLMAIAAAKYSGAGRIFATDIDEPKLEVAKQMGADVTINTRSQTASEVVLNATGGRGVDAVIDYTGNNGAISDAFKALKLHGQFTMVGLPGGNLTLDATNGIIYKEATVVGVTGRLMYQTWFECEKLLKTPGFDLKPALGGIYPLEKYEDAFQALFSGAPGKMVLTLEDGLEF